jgi:hypothetical protein
VSALRAAAGALLLLSCAACDDVNIGAPKPPGPSCRGFDDYVHTIAVGHPAGGVLDAAAAGSFAFTAGGSTGVSVIDIGDPADVRVVAALGALSDARAVDAAGAWLFVANGGDGLALVDVSSPSAPVVARVVPMPGTAVDVRVSGSHLFVADDPLGLVVVDAADPASASIVGIENTPGAPVGVAVSGTLAFVADRDLGLRVVNAADPASPFLVKSVALPGFRHAVDARDSLVAVAVGPAGVSLVDVSVPAFASVVGTFDTPWDARGVALAGDVAYVADGPTGVVLVDVSDASAPAARGSIGTPQVNQKVAVYGGRLAIADGAAGVRIVDISPDTAAPVDSIAAEGDARSLSSMGDLVVVADASFGLRVVDPAARAVVGELAITGEPRDVFVADSVAYVARGADSVVIADLHDPAAPVATGAITTPSFVDAVGVDGELAYLLDSGGLLVERRIDGTGVPRAYSASNVFFPSLTMARHFAFGTLVFLPDARGSVTVIFASGMRPLTVFPVGGSAQRVLIRYVDGPSGPGTGIQAYVAMTISLTGQSAVELYDFANHLNPTLLARVYCGGGAADVALTDARLIVGEAEDGCEIFERLSGDRARPMGLVMERAMRVAVSGGTLVVAGGKSGILFASLEDCLE